MTANATASQPDRATGDGLEAEDVGATPHYLYFLVCVAREGALANTFKLGITDRLPGRHHEHAREWAGFDLDRSALLQAGSRQDARGLESALCQLFGDPRAERQDRAQGRVLCSADFLAAGSNRRHPGRRGAGYTEFYALACLPRMLEYVQAWITPRQAREPRLRLLQGAELASSILPSGTRAAAAATTPPLTKEERTAQRAQHQAEVRRQAEEENARLVDKMARGLALAQEYEAHLVWVDLKRWQEARRRSKTEPGWSVSALADLYFGGFGVAPGTLIDWEEPTGEPAHFRAGFERIEMPPSDESLPWHLAERRAWAVRQQQAWLWQEPSSLHRGEPPHPFCREALRLRLDPWRTDLVTSFLPQFEALAQRVASRHRWEQPLLFGG